MPLGEIFQPVKSVKFCMSSRKWVERVGVSVKSRRLGSRIDRGRNGHKVTRTFLKIKRWYKFSWARKKRKNFAKNRRELTSQKTDCVSITFPLFSFFKVDMEGAQRIGIEAITSSKDGRGTTSDHGYHRVSAGPW